MVDPSVKPGEYVAQTLFLEFIAMAEKKIAAVSQEPIVSRYVFFLNFMLVLLFGILANRIRDRLCLVKIHNSYFTYFTNLLFILGKIVDEITTTRRRSSIWSSKIFFDYYFYRIHCLILTYSFCSFWTLYAASANIVFLRYCALCSLGTINKISNYICWCNTKLKRNCKASKAIRVDRIRKPYSNNNDRNEIIYWKNEE